MTFPRTWMAVAATMQSAMGTSRSLHRRPPARVAVRGVNGNKDRPLAITDSAHCSALFRPARSQTLQKNSARTIVGITPEPVRLRFLNLPRALSTVSGSSEKKCSMRNRVSRTSLNLPHHASRPAPSSPLRRARISTDSPPDPLCQGLYSSTRDVPTAE